MCTIHRKPWYNRKSDHKVSNIKPKHRYNQHATQVHTLTDTQEDNCLLVCSMPKITWKNHFYMCVCECERERERYTIKDSKQTNYLPFNTINSCLIKIFHWRPFSWRACISIAELSILTVATYIHLVLEASHAISMLTERGSIKNLVR